MPINTLQVITETSLSSQSLALVLTRTIKRENMKKKKKHKTTERNQVAVVVRNQDKIDDTDRARFTSTVRDIRPGKRSGPFFDGAEPARGK